MAQTRVARGAGDTCDLCIGGIVEERGEKTNSRGYRHSREAV